MVEAVAAYELIQRNGDGERSGLSSFLFDDGETISGRKLKSKMEKLIPGGKVVSPLSVIPALVSKYNDQ